MSFPPPTHRRTNISTCNHPQPFSTAPAAAPAAPPDSVTTSSTSVPPPAPTSVYSAIQPTVHTRQTGKDTKVVILGTGWAGFNVAKSLSAKQATKINVISPSNHFVFTPLLPSTAVGTLEFRSIQEPIRTIPNVHYYQAKAKYIDHVQKEVVCTGLFDAIEFRVCYDVLVIAVGVKTNTFKTMNIEEREGKEVFFLKHLYHARAIRNRTIEMFEMAALPGTSEAEARRLLSFIIVGGGPTSCEYAAELHDFLVKDVRKLYPDLIQYVTVHLVEAGPALLGPFDVTLRSYVERLFKTRDINVQTSTAVKGVEVFNSPNYRHEATRANLSNGTSIEFGTMVWSAGLAPVKFVESVSAVASNLPGVAPPIIGRAKNGRLLVDQYCRVLGHEGTIWAIGDCCVNEAQPLPQLAQVAQQQAKYIADHLISSNAADQPKNSFRFFSLGSMASVGMFEGIYDGSSVGDPYAPPPKGLRPTLRGFWAFCMWRSAYWGKQVSLGNKILIPMYWFKSWMFGRDISKF